MIIPQIREWSKKNTRLTADDETSVNTGTQTTEHWERERERERERTQRRRT